MTDHEEHMSAPAVVAARKAYAEHEAGCAVCQAATRQRGLCPEGVRLHDAAVVAAQAAYRESRS